MLSAKSQSELGRLVSENVLSFDQKFWLRLAARSDTAASQEEKQSLVSLADCVMGLVDAVVKRTEQQQTASQTVLEKILRAAADDAGRWEWPLPDDKLQAMRQAMDQAGALDEAILSQTYAWMRKVADHDPGFVALLQKVLQLYAAKALVARSPDGVDASLDQILEADEAQWADRIKGAAANGISEAAFLEALQKRMERTALACAAGSYAQRVQAEYLKEVEERARSVYGGMAGK
ncbi:hypothetical protein WJX72_008197 [[Myrmecia] bisecta]|uniref:Uncharacterized protein n=1 Tax=[Myrmecia] bisecta TaxID=41462 RepID=A0AAW1QFT1_9CHLO